jgi:hypothetical protein
MPKPKPRLITSPAPLYRVERQLAPKGVRAFQAAVKTWRDYLAKTNIAHGGPALASALDGMDPKALDKLVSVTQEGAKKGGQIAAAQLNAALETKLSFNLTNPAAVAWTERNAARLVREITDESKAAIRSFIGEAMRGNYTVDSTARQLRAIVGLTERQERAVWKFREDLITNMGKTEVEALRLAEEYAYGLRAHRAVVIARTEILRGEASGQQLLWDQGIAAGQLGKDRLEKAWAVANDERLCERCAPMDGVAVGIDEPWIVDGEEHMIPNTLHPQCLPGDALVSFGRCEAVARRWFEGDLFIIRTAHKRQLAVTANHPILTRAGWVAARFLNVGGDVICTGRREGPEFRHDVNDQDRPSPIHEVAEAFRRRAGVFAEEVKVTAPDFHGDGESSEVAVVWTDGLLVDRDDTLFAQRLRQFYLRWADAVSQRTKRFVSGSPADLAGKRDRASSHGCVGMSSLTLSLLECHASPFQGLGFALPSGLYPGAPQAVIDDRPGRVEPMGQCVDRRASAVERHKIIDRQNHLRARLVRPRLAPGNPGSFQPDVDHPDTDAELARQINAGAAGEIFADQIVSIGTVHYRSHVYNLQTKTGFFTADGIVTHNCRCSSALVEREDYEP